ncbi:MAG TPA: phosphoribosylanthranilate isomerase [Spongiibacteraceae bacterium]|jgi:phosphoribosylanthranilate isomerase|nr:phosphoribosylanthranilate isomerase [Spongiibacteraceae bacterium]HUH39182.1 phosphoribosylanthranilate isomerase [Spongiibacteraceae bacterium]
MHPSRTRIKICGLTTPEQARAAADCGVDAIGLVFYAPSPRAVDIARARAICAALPAFVAPVGLFVDADDAYVREVVAALPLQLLQFHGAESLAYCEQFARPYVKALRMRADADVVAVAAQYPSARALLLDSYRRGTPGGTGETFDWQRIPGQLRGRVILAGGLGVDNVAAAVTAIGPAAVDVSGGVESAPGRKDPQKIQQFVAQVQLADRQRSASFAASQDTL